MKQRGRWMRILMLYYGILQSLHLLTLARAGLLILRGVAYPFPILPPPGGWETQSMAFLFGLAGTDVVGILLGIIFAGQLLIKGKLNRTLGILSLTIFITGAVVFGAGTFPSGAWAAHPVAYGVMVVLFAPALLLFQRLLKYSKAD
jgi:hypothetical protein